MKIYSSENTRKWDEFTIEQEPVASIDLMERAATVCTKHILGSFYLKSAAIICGPGNNGGDGLVIARLLSERGIEVNVYLLEIGKKKSEDFKANLDRLSAEIEQVVINESNGLPELNENIIIDAIFGSGLNKSLDGWIAELVNEMNNSNVPIVAIDIPSGMYADVQIEEGSPAVRAVKTISFQCPKMSFFFVENDEFLGDWTVVDIGLHKDYQADEEAIFVKEDLIDLKERKRHDHKGSNGFLSIVAGIGGMPGAAILASKSAFRTGCGYVATTASQASYAPLMAAVPELLPLDPDGLVFPKKSTALLIGPGIGKSEESKKWVKVGLDGQLPLLLDADAINLLSAESKWIPLIPENTILTPHIGELRRLIGEHANSAELLKAQREFSVNHKVYILQKGPNSKLSCPDGKLYINSTGNPGMATAGMGDVLSGMIGSFLAQGYDSLQASLNGMYLHGLAGDLVARNNGQRGMISSDVLESIPEVLRSF